MGVGQDAVALSADGNTALVGGAWQLRRLPTPSTGAVWVFTRSDGEWIQEGQKLVGTGAIGQASQGWSVALSADGNTAVVGGPADNNYSGAVWVFTRSGGVWTQQGPKLVGSGAIGSVGAKQGGVVAVSADGNTLAEGGIFDNGHSYDCGSDPDLCFAADGAVWVFTRSNGVWTQQGSKLVGTGGPDAIGDLQGYTVALSADGNTLAESDNTVGTWVFTRSGGVWQQQGGELQGGFFVSLTGDGNTLLDGGTFYHRNNGVWTQTGTVLAPDGTHPLWVAPDGRAAAGITRANQVSVFTNCCGVWSFHHDYFGKGATQPLAGLNGLAFSANANTMIYSSAGDGAAWVFASPQLSTKLAHTGNFHQGQTGAVYTITVTNAGDRATTSDVDLVDHAAGRADGDGPFRRRLDLHAGHGELHAHEFPGGGCEFSAGDLDRERGEQCSGQSNQCRNRVGRRLGLGEYDGCDDDHALAPRAVRCSIVGRAIIAALTGSLTNIAPANGILFSPTLSAMRVSLTPSFGRDIPIRFLSKELRLGCLG